MFSGLFSARCTSKRNLRIWHAPPHPHPTPACSFEKLFQRRGMCRCCKLPEQSNFFSSSSSSWRREVANRESCLFSASSLRSIQRKASDVNYMNIANMSHRQCGETKLLRCMNLIMHLFSTTFDAFPHQPLLTLGIFSLRGYISFTVSYLQIDPSKLN